MGSTLRPGQLSFEWDRVQLLRPDEIYSLADEPLLRLLKEDRRVERKPPGLVQRHVGEYMSMWSNTAPSGGLIALGIQDDGTITGCRNLSQTQLNDIEESGKIYCPDAKYEFKRVAVRAKDGRSDFVVLIRVYYRPDKVVLTTNGDGYHRLGESKRKLTREEINELQRDKRQVDFEMEPSRAAYPKDFDRELIAAFVDTVQQERYAGVHLTDEQVLELRHLGVIRDGVFQPNNACLLLFGTDPCAEFPGCKIRFLRFDGETEHTGDRFNAVKDQFIEGPIPSQIVALERLLASQLREFARLGADGKFYSAQEYPKAAWYEVIVNACVHRSYGLRSMNIFVRMFDDRLEVESPGPFPPTVTSENIYSVHHPRNPRLMDAMYYLKFVMCAHEGARRIRDSMRQMRLPDPVFRQQQPEISHSVVRVTLRNDIRQRRVWVDATAAALVGEAIDATLTEDERRAINFVAEHGKITVTQLQRVTGRTWKTAKRALQRLQARSILMHVKKRHVDRDPDAHYVLRKKT